MKIPSEMDGQGPTSSSNQKFDKSCTSSVYISQPSVSVSNDHVSTMCRAATACNNNDQAAPNQNQIDVVANGGEPLPHHQKPVLTIQVNQNNHSNANQQSSSNLVNIVSCFRAYPNASHVSQQNISSTVMAGNENSSSAENSNLSVSSAAPFSVSVNRHHRDDGDAAAKKRQRSVSGGESVNNENNQNIINIDASLKSDHEAHSNSTVKREVDDLNEICVAADTSSSSPCSAKSNNNNVDYIRNSSPSSTTTLEINTNGLPSSTSSITTTTTIDPAPLDDGNENERKMVIGNSATDTGSNIAKNVINHSATIETVVVDVESKEERSSATKTGEELELTSKSSESQSHREQRRRERRERRQARQRAQHGHHHISTAPIHQLRANIANAHASNASANGIRTFNGAEQARATGNYDILPDIVNIQPPPYTSLPSPSAIRTISPISPVPVVVDDCRFSFPIPIIRR